MAVSCCALPEQHWAVRFLSGAQLVLAVRREQDGFLFPSQTCKGLF